MHYTLDNALDILLQALDDTYSVDIISEMPLDTVHERLRNFIVDEARIGEAVKAKLNRKGHSLRRLNNKRALLHQLPPEIICNILAESVDGMSSDNCMDRYYQLAQVCKHWFDIIVGSSRFWHHATYKYSDERIDMILNHHRAGRFSFRCSTDYPDPFMKKIRTKAADWTRFRLDICFSDEVKSALEEPTPNLRAICMRISGSSGRSVRGTKRIALSDGCPLSVVDLECVALHWDSTRLAGLLRLQLIKLDAFLPTLRQLHTILTLSPKLEFLALVEWYDLQDTVSHEEDLHDINQTVVLPCLKMVDLRRIPSTYKTYLFDHIECCGLQTVLAGTVISHRPLVTCESAGCHVTCGPLRAARHIQVAYGTGGTTCHLQSIPVIEPMMDKWSDGRREPPGFNYTFDLGGADATWWRNFGAFLSEHCQNAERVILVLDAAQASIRNSDGDLVAPPCLPLEILDESFRFVNDLTFKSHYDAGSVLEFLSRPRRTEEGLVRWSCPKLKVCDLRNLIDVRSRSADILRFAEARIQATSTTEGEPPDALKTVKLPRGMLETFSGSEALKSVTFEH